VEPVVKGAAPPPAAALPTPPAAALPPPGYEYGDARRRYVELYGSTLVANRYLRLALGGLTVVAAGLIALNLRTERLFQNFRPLVIRIDDVGRATAVSYAALTYSPQAPELKYFLSQFVIKHYSRMRATVRQQYGESLYFLDGRLADAIIEVNKKAGSIERFLAGAGDEIDVAVRNVALEDLREAPFRGAVEFEKVYLAAATRSEIKRETFVAHFVFVIRDQVDNARIPINPLGLTITYFREDQAFVPSRGRGEPAS
jgi:type IV secretory pathway TrbF-like protein